MSNRIGLYLIVLGAFFTGTAELVVGGILDIIADDLRISVGAAGQLVTAYSLAYAVGTPLIVSLTPRVSRTRLLIGSQLAFVLGCLVVPLSDSFTVLLVSRAILGASTGVFAVVAFSAAAKLVPPERTGRAVGMVSLGISCATVLGVPAGVVISGWWSWQGIFLALAACSAVVALGMMRLLPAIEGDAPAPFARQFAVLRNPVLLIGLASSFCFTASSSIVNTYMVPLLRDVLALPASALSLAMLALGLSGVVGSRAGGVGVDRLGSARMIVFGLALAALALFALPALHGYWLGGMAVTAVWSFAMSLTIPAILTYFIRQEPSSSNLVLGLNTSVLHLGVAVGAAAGGGLANGLSTALYHPVAAGGLSALGLLAAFASFAAGRRRATSGLAAERHGSI